jgi:hypothetical protein
MVTGPSSMANPWFPMNPYLLSLVIVDETSCPRDPLYVPHDPIKRGGGP